MRLETGGGSGFICNYDGECSAFLLSGFGGILVDIRDEITNSA